MAENRPKYMNWILECINLLRSRKSRPDLERICRTMLKCHGIEEQDTEEDLRSLVQAGIVTRRSFKGAISYRNSAGWNRTHGPGKVSRAGRWVGEAIRTLDHGFGANAQDIERYVAAKHPYYNNLKPRIKLSLKEDIEHGRIWMVGEGMYRLLESAESPEREICTTEPICDFCLQTSECNRNGEFENLLICRDCGNKAHPSCMNYSTDLTTRIRDDAGSWQCIDCKTCVICNDSGDPGSLLFCDACDKGYHMQCHVPPLESMPSGKWICYNCVNHPTNPARLEENNGVIDIKVQRGQRSRHTSEAHSSTGASSYLQDEDMEECLVEVKDMHVQVDAENVQRELEMLSQATPPCTPPSSSATPTNSDAAATASDKEPNSSTTPQGDAAAKENSSTANNKPDVKNMSADASKWEVTDVITFLESAGFKEESKNFKDQEIDGAALLLMSRNDVLTGMSLKLGPALKIYSHVSKLQRCQPKVPLRSSTH